MQASLLDEPTKSGLSSLSALDIGHESGSAPTAVRGGLPIDADARAHGMKVSTRTDANLYRSPRLGSVATYTVPAGTSLYVSPTADRNWLQVRLSRGRSVFVQKDKTDANLALLIAQGSVPDVKRLTPAPKGDLEPDSGNRQSGSHAEKDQKLTDAIDASQESFQQLSAGFESLRNDVAGFNGSPETWPAAKSSSLQALSEFDSELRSFSAALRDMSAASGSMSANQRSAYQGIVSEVEELTQATAELRRALSQLSDGADWSGQLGDVADATTLCGTSLEVILRLLNRL